jgi:hypothetical protein
LEAAANPDVEHDFVGGVLLESSNGIVKNFPMKNFWENDKFPMKNQLHE